MKTSPTKKPLDWPQRRPRLSLAQSFRCAFSGLSFVFQTQRNIRVHAVAAVAGIVLGICVGLSRFEWAVLTLLIAAVFSAEIINTAIKLLVDLVSPEYHEAARAAKDAAAAAVLCLALASGVIALLFFAAPLKSWILP
ncbi:MAG TPA: diacylglycerol kinase family protein [Planctomycetaceae bacterium]|nr:diacylglycerol kinase family protein [Planctomycetaceae bacterium]